MKSVEDRVWDLMTSLGIPFDSDKHKKIVIRVKEQDKITRHACADNIHNMDHGYAAKTDTKVVGVDKAFNVVMNTKAV